MLEICILQFRNNILPPPLCVRSQFNNNNKRITKAKREIKGSKQIKGLKVIQ